MSFPNATAATRTTGTYIPEGSSKSRESSPRSNDRIGTTVERVAKLSMHDSSSKIVASDVSPKGSFFPSQVSKDGEDEALVEAIIADTQGDLSDALYLCSEELIPSSKLFAAIMRRVHSALEALDVVKNIATKTEEGKKAIEIAQKPIVQLLNFCIMWVKKNRGTPPFRSCEDLLQMLIKMSFEQNDATIGALACLLSKLAFDVPLFWSQYARPLFQWSFKETFEGIVKCADDFFKGSKKQEEGVSRIAQDLYCYQVEIFRAFDQRDLIKSHMGGSFGPSIKRHTEYANAIHALVMETILERKALTDRVKAIWAWLLIAQRSEELGDYMNWTNICGGLEEFSVSRLKKTWKEVEEKHPKQYAHMLMYRTSVSKNYTKLEEEIKRRKEEAIKNGKNLQFLPFVPSLLMKLVKSQELVSVRDTPTAGVRCYNIQKIVGVLKDVREYFSFQGNWDENKKPALPNTDVVYKALEIGPKNSDEREKKEQGYIALSHALEPPLKPATSS